MNRTTLFGMCARRLDALRAGPAIDVIRVTLALLAIVSGPVAPGTAGAATPPRPMVEAAGRDWRALFDRDLDYLVDAIPRHYIYAVRPGGADWQALFERLVARARDERQYVVDYASYRAVLQHFVVGFEDAHLSAYFDVVSRRARWPRFAVGYRGARFQVTRSRVDAATVGAEVVSCDGRSMNDWIDLLAAYYGGPAGRDTTRAAVARQMFVDRGNPLHALPRTCRIGERDVDLQWSDVRSEDRPSVGDEPERTSTPAPTLSDASVDVAELPRSTAWVRIGTMLPTTQAEADRFRALIERAPALRSRRLVVIDVRGNAGGNYNWFMAFLRAFYGAEYADYYARARLEIANTIMVLSPTGADDPGFAPETTRIAVPPDPPMEAKAAPPNVVTLTDGRRLIEMPPPVASMSWPERAPPRATSADVIVLTDWGCASACLSFVDEMMRFPGVTLAGTETHLDRRSGGWPEGFALPSGLATVRMGRMVREGRRRGENEPWVPSFRFDGDIADTVSVRRWVLDVVAPAVRAQRAR